MTDSIMDWDASCITKHTVIQVLPVILFQTFYLFFLTYISKPTVKSIKAVGSKPQLKPSLKHKYIKYPMKVRTAIK